MKQIVMDDTTGVGPWPGSHVNTDWKQRAGQRKMEADAQRQISHKKGTAKHS